MHTYIHTYRCFWSREVNSFGHPFMFNSSMRQLLWRITNTTYINSYIGPLLIQKQIRTKRNTYLHLYVRCILFRNVPRSQAVMRSTAYVSQDNVHYPQLTVLEVFICSQIKVAHCSCKHTCINTFLLLHIIEYFQYPCMHIYIHTFIHVYLHTYIHTLHTYIHTYIDCLSRYNYPSHTHTYIHKYMQRSTNRAL